MDPQSILWKGHTHRVFDRATTIGGAAINMNAIRCSSSRRTIRQCTPATATATHWSRLRRGPDGAKPGCVMPVASLGVSTVAHLHRAPGAAVAHTRRYKCAVSGRADDLLERLEKISSVLNDRSLLRRCARRMARLASAAREPEGHYPSAKHLQPHTNDLKPNKAVRIAGGERRRWVVTTAVGATHRIGS